MESINLNQNTLEQISIDNQQQSEIIEEILMKEIKSPNQISMIFKDKKEQSQPKLFSLPKRNSKSKNNDQPEENQATDDKDNETQATAQQQTQQITTNLNDQTQTTTNQQTQPSTLNSNLSFHNKKIVEILPMLTKLKYGIVEKQYEELPHSTIPRYEENQEEDQQEETESNSNPEDQEENQKNYQDDYGEEMKKTKRQCSEKQVAKFADLLLKTTLYNRNKSWQMYIADEKKRIISQTPAKKEKLGVLSAANSKFLKSYSQKHFITQQTSQNDSQLQLLNDTTAFNTNSTMQLNLTNESQFYANLSQNEFSNELIKQFQKSVEILIVHEVQKHCEINLQDENVQELILEFVYKPSPNMDALYSLIAKIIKLMKVKTVKNCESHSNCFHLSRSPIEYKPLSNIQVQQVKKSFRYQQSSSCVKELIAERLKTKEHQLFFQKKQQKRCESLDNVNYNPVDEINLQTLTGTYEKKLTFKEKILRHQQQVEAERERKKQLKHESKIKEKFEQEQQDLKNKIKMEQLRRQSTLEPGIQNIVENDEKLTNTYIWMQSLTQHQLVSNLKIMMFFLKLQKDRIKRKERNFYKKMKSSESKTEQPPLSSPDINKNDPSFLQLKKNQITKEMEKLKWINSILVQQMKNDDKKRKGIQPTVNVLSEVFTNSVYCTPSEMSFNTFLDSKKFNISNQRTQLPEIKVDKYPDYSWQQFTLSSKEKKIIQEQQQLNSLAMKKQQLSVFKTRRFINHITEIQHYFENMLGSHEQQKESYNEFFENKVSDYLNKLNSDQISQEELNSEMKSDMISNMYSELQTSFEKSVKVHQTYSKNQCSVKNAPQLNLLSQRIKTVIKKIQNRKLIDEKKLKKFKAFH